jgi:hypothetical protein
MSLDNARRAAFAASRLGMLLNNAAPREFPPVANLPTRQTYWRRPPVDDPRTQNYFANGAVDAMNLEEGRFWR